MLLQRLRKASLGSGARSMAELLLSRSRDDLSLLPDGIPGNLRERARERTHQGACVDASPCDNWVGGPRTRVTRYSPGTAWRLTAFKQLLGSL
jgi:hypothetical protein